MKQCSWCGHDFKATVSYQIYCSTECRSFATKEKIIERHKVLKVQKRRKKQRHCKNCNEPLSIYSEDVFCYFCNIDPKLVSKALRELKKLGIMDYEQDNK